MTNSQVKYLDLSGYMFSGKSAFSDLLREFDGFDVPNYHTEFDLIRISGGLLDLRSAVVDNWSPMRADASLRRFIKLMKILSCTPKGHKRLLETGFGYEDNYPNIVDATAQFVSNITEDSWVMEWPYEMVELSSFDIFKTKISSKIKKQLPWPKIEFRLVKRNNFDFYAKNFINNILSFNKNSKINTIVTHNALEAYSPQNGFCFFSDIKSIVIDRDVRDIYMTSVTKNPGYNDNVNVFSNITGAFDIDVFIKRQKELRNTKNDTFDNLLRINFEDLVFNYDDTISKVYDFLDVDCLIHNNKMKFFNPNTSRKNTRLWENNDAESHLQEIKIIEEKLPQYCYLDNCE